MMLWLALAAYCLSTLLIAGAHRYRIAGWARAWLYLAATTVAFRLFLWVFPAESPLLSRLLIFAGLGALSWFYLGRRNPPGRHLRPTWTQLPFVLIAVFVMARNAFPNYDVDSLSYHLAATRWLTVKHLLPDLQREAHGVYLAYRFIGLEEFLGIPANDGNFPLWAGLIGGWTKVLALFTVLSLVPARLPFLSYLAAFLVLVDDHFFFSGQNRFVYLHPALLGMVVPAFWFLWRGIRGQRSLLPTSFGLLLCLGYDKYHGLFFGVVAAGVLALSILHPHYRRWLSVRTLKECAVSPFVWVGLAGCFAFFGLNWLETGTPVYPYLVNGIGGPPAGAQQILDSTYFKEGWAALLRHFAEDKYKVFTYPGNMALKLLVVFFFPALVMLAVRPKRWNLRHLEFAAFGLLISVGWVLMCNIINYETSRYHGRYPRFVYLLTICAISYLGASAGSWLPAFRSKPARLAQHGAGAFLLLWIVFSVDTRYFNVTRSQRPGWPDIAAYWRDPAPFAPSVVPEVMKPLLEDWVGRDLPLLRECFVMAEPGLPSKELEAILGGKGVILLDEQLNWPNSHFGGNALRPDLNVGISPDLNQYRYLLVSKRYRKELPGGLGADEAVGKLAGIWKRAEPICRSPDYELFRL